VCQARDMRARRQRLRLGLLAATGLIAAALGILAWATDAFESLEVRTIDARFSLRGEEKAPDVAVVGIDEQTIEDLEMRPPFPRSIHGRVIDRLRRDGAKIIAYDLEFTEPTDVEEDNALFDATRRAGNVVLATSRVGPRGQTDVFGGPEGVREARATVGSTNLDTISGRVYRFLHDENGLPSFPVAAAERATGRPVGREHFDDDDDQAWIDFAGPPSTIETTSLSRVLEGRFRPGMFRDKIVVVGSTALILQDIQSTAAGENMPGPEIVANAISTILDGFPLDEPPGWLAVVLIALLGLAAPLAAVPLHGLRWLGPALLALGVYIVAVQLAFAGGSILPVVPALLAFVVGLLATLAVTYATELRDRRRLRAQFARFVPASVVDEVVARAEHEDLRLGGVRREGTVLFCDLRGFTAAAEAMAAERVIDVLNHYLSEMSEAILDHGGTVVSYMGDGIMAVFGAPLEQEDHRDRAVAAAREMATTRLERFNAWVREAGVGDGFRMGIGVCSGPVMSGNVGSQRRLEYAAVGDTTNMASRLEAMTKEAGHPVLIAETTAKWLASGAEDGLVYVGELPVRGRTATVKVWTLGGA
jgi:adenylate cyclase